jgi:hypothetical protein
MTRSGSLQRSWAFAALIALLALVVGCGTSTQSVGPSGQASTAVAVASPSTQATPSTPVSPSTPARDGSVARDDEGVALRGEQDAWRR